jgi:hypothetical protein
LSSCVDGPAQSGGQCCAASVQEAVLCCLCGAALPCYLARLLSCHVPPSFRVVKELITASSTCWLSMWMQLILHQRAKCQLPASICHHQAPHLTYHAEQVSPVCCRDAVQEVSFQRTLSTSIECLLSARFIHSAHVRLKCGSWRHTNTAHLLQLEFLKLSNKAALEVG